MNKDEALKLALSALNEVRQETFRLMRDGQTLHAEKKVWEAIYTIKKVLAQPQQEPVACKRCKQLEEQAYDLVGELRVANIKLSMRPQRTWVGLTDDEIWEAYMESPMELDCSTDELYAISRTVEAKLKEKNK